MPEHFERSKVAHYIYLELVLHPAIANIRISTSLKTPHHHIILEGWKRGKLPILCYAFYYKTPKIMAWCFLGGGCFWFLGGLSDDISYKHRPHKLKSFLDRKQCWEKGRRFRHETYILRTWKQIYKSLNIIWWLLVIRVSQIFGDFSAKFFWVGFYHTITTRPHLGHLQVV